MDKNMKIEMGTGDYKGITVYKKCQHWALQSVNITYIGPLGFSGTAIQTAQFVSGP